MLDGYWSSLALPFRAFVLDVAENPAGEAYHDWINRVVGEGNRAFREASQRLGDDASALRKRVTGRRICGSRLARRRADALATVDRSKPTDS